ncbi:enoyl-CoA hydratase/isomerase family protein [Acidisphaera sp. L21]|jgi:enoyl-CoA hydratase|uniref:enoyl-CoA hydratase/isomerase family protein n=1 Tax=Acidisphaera sp. L21 TaxID=1641851 RepID=UPI00131A8EB8|nr:enoyl-CoA hydratase-related protein [Acidisphaera sp. L21]
MSVVQVETRGPISIIRLNQPGKMNAISARVAVELQEAFQAFDRSDQRVAILSSVGDRAFCSGADTTDLPELWRCVPGVGFRTDKPIIAATTGWCVGGGIVLVMMCDLMVSTESTIFYYPEAKLGLTGGMISSLASRMPHKLAMEIMLLGSKVKAQRAYDVGFVNRVVPDGQHETEALAMAEQLLGGAPLVLSTLKRLVEEIIPPGPVERMMRTTIGLAAVRNSDDLKEGLAANREKRAPRFTGR